MSLPKSVINLVARRPEVDVAGFWRDGYCVVRGVFSPDEIERFRTLALEFSGPKGDLLSTPGINDAMLNSGLVGIARSILGENEILYAGDGSFTVNGTQHGFHKDNADRDDLHAPDWEGRYTILRFGIYLQDHLFHSGGVNIRRGSHNTTSLEEGANWYPRTRIGDVAVWSLRSTHSGNALQSLFPWWRYPMPGNRVENPKWWRIAPAAPGDRVAIFVALGLNDKHHERYTRYLKTRSYMVNVWRRSHYDESTLTRAADVGLSVRNVPLEVEKDNTVGEHVAWAPLPY